ncbi:rust resistance kinase Lr10-like isoform X1 [Rhodamnia argentea]|uniref:Rust resistance kinase Lr10-like isoform X1 n=1 Tax=Rhodamnia argentea TaxID=178133 RepID=A0ABM3GRW2_9MYRT|nr:rust resistance kinase Lr10-like isoform X1 [Rhodamnia argentea]
MHSPIPSLFLLLLLLLFFLCFAHGTAAPGPPDHPCRPTKCHHGPHVMFPFWLDHAECGYPGFQLFCDENGRTALRLSNTTQGSLLVKSINYHSQSVLLHDPNSCLPFWIANLSRLGFAYSYPHTYTYNYTLFKCPPPQRTSLIEVRCQSQPGPDRVYAVYSDESVGDSPLVYCERNGKLDWLPERIDLIIAEARFNWKEPDCRSCRHNGSLCGRNGSDIICLPPPRGYPGRRRAEIAGGLVGSYFLLAGVIGVGYVLNERRRDKAFQLRIEGFLHDYEALKPTRYSYNDVKRITNDFEEKLGQGSYGTVYKGKLSSEIFVAVKMLDNSFGNGEEFINEVSTMGRIHHVNVVRMVGFCADGFRRALVYEFLPNESLEKFIFPGEDALGPSLSWERLHDIALGVAKGIEYLHQGCDHRILHFDIKPHNILLDDNFNPKIADFGLAKLCSKEQSAVSMTAARGTMGYIAPEVFSRNFGSVSSKSDVYSFGMLLLEMVGGRKNVDVNAKNMSQMYFPQWVYNHLNKGEELEIRIREDGDHNIARKLAIVGLWCIHWYPADRPPMKAVVQMLEGEECPVMPKNPFVSSSGSGEAATMPGRLWNTNLEVIEE